MFVRLLPWVVAWSLLCLAVLSLPSFGLFIAPVALVALGAAAWRADENAAGPGFAIGVALPLLAIGLMNLGYTPCPEDGVLTIEPGEDSAECGGWNPVPWLVAGGVLAGLGVRSARRG